MKWCVISLVIYNVTVIEMRSYETFVYSKHTIYKSFIRPHLDCGLFIAMSSGRNLFERLFGMITTWHICFSHRSRITSLSSPLKVSMIIKDICSFGYLRLAFSCFRYGNITFRKAQLIFPYSTNGYQKRRH